MQIKRIQIFENRNNKRSYYFFVFLKLTIMWLNTSSNVSLYIQYVMHAPRNYLPSSNDVFAKEFRGNFRGIFPRY